MLNILRTFQLGFHRFFSLYLFHVESARPRREHRPTAQNTPTTVANSRETNKQPQLQKQAQYFLMIYYHQYYLLSIIYYQ